jgi:hypothetical protein
MTAQIIEKVLSANDTGETGGHQAGLLVPKDPSILDFFPLLDAFIKNPRTVLDMVDDRGREWAFNFIYYNNSLFGGTRNEFRLTGMTAFFREFDLKAGDTVILSRVSPKRLSISYRRAKRGIGTIKISGTWKVIQADF